MVEAQKLLFEVLRVHAQSCAKTNILTAKLAKGLRRTGERQSEIASHVVELADRLKEAEAELEQLRAKAAFNPADEYSWDEEHRLLLYKVMVLASLADNRSDPEEDTFLEYKLSHLELGDESMAEAAAFKCQPKDCRSLLRQIDRHSMKVVFFRNALAVSYADGRLLFRERLFLNKLAKQLELHRDDKRRLWDEFARINLE